MLDSSFNGPPMDSEIAGYHTAIVPTAESEFGIGFPRPAADAANERTITGTVVETAGNKEEKITPAGIATESEGKFEVAGKDEGAELMNMIDKKLEVSGSVHEPKEEK
ncbi:MAG: hypothetical protein HY788_11110 [Deltaproteobacteria bacterium]|nr:hypothetical protein [Deltaproteobacteria bacterium]